jgi:hypothetical protein
VQSAILDTYSNQQLDKCQESESGRQKTNYGVLMLFAKRSHSFKRLRHATGMIEDKLEASFLSLVDGLKIPTIY